MGERARGQAGSGQVGERARRQEGKRPARRWGGRVIERARGRQGSGRAGDGAGG